MDKSDFNKKYKYFSESIKEMSLCDISINKSYDIDEIQLNEDIVLNGLFFSVEDDFDDIKDYLAKIKEQKNKDYLVVLLPFLVKNNNGNKNILTSPFYITADFNRLYFRLETLFKSINKNSNKKFRYKLLNKFSNLYFNTKLTSKHHRQSIIDKENLENLKIELLEYFNSLDKNISLYEYLSIISKSYVNYSYKDMSYYKNSIYKAMTQIPNTEYQSKITIAIIKKSEIIDNDVIHLGLRRAYERMKIGDEVNPFIHIFTNYKGEINLYLDYFLLYQSMHLGSFDTNTLTRSQRIAMSIYQTKISVLPVNGPPGTGKTSLLRAIFADYIVKKSIKSYELYKSSGTIGFANPIVATSTNSQAIINIMEGINSGFLDMQKYNKSRWLKLPPITIEDKKIDIINISSIKLTSRNDKYDNITNTLSLTKDTLFSYLYYLFSNKSDNLVEYYLSHTNHNTIEKCIEDLYNNIEKNKSIIENKIQELLKEYETDKNNNQFIDKCFSVCESLDTIRVDIFYDALHIIEGIFLLYISKNHLNGYQSTIICPFCLKQATGYNKDNCKGFFCRDCKKRYLYEHNGVILDNSFKKNRDYFFEMINAKKIDDFEYKGFSNLKYSTSQKEKSNYIDFGITTNYEKFKVQNIKIDIINNFKFNLISTIFPLITSTMHSIYNHFKNRTEQIDLFEPQQIDLVLCDESGMILTPIALPALYIAKKCIIVGDEKQIEPIYPYSQILDKAIAKNSDEYYHDIKNIEKDTFFTTNLIKEANKTIKTYHFNMSEIETKTNAIWLREHFRCKDEIIEYCNDIVYDGILIPCTKKYNIEKAFNNNIKIIDIDNNIVENNISTKEAVQIRKFLDKHIKSIHKELNNLYQKILSCDEVIQKIGIITPFNNQKIEIKKHLKNGDNYDYSNIIVGTVHSFQGSERELIIFSPVISSDINYTHFSNSDNGNMLNVAVSRAKSAFVVISSIKGMKECGKYTNKLVEYVQKIETDIK